MKQLSTDRLVAFAWEMGDLVDASVRAGEPETPWRTYARLLEKQARAEVRERLGLVGHGESN